jgi:hypothetical protein
MVECGNVALSYWSPFYVDSRDYRVRSSCGVSAFVCVCVLKSLMDCLPSSILMIGDRSPL